MKITLRVQVEENVNGKPRYGVHVRGMTSVLYSGSDEKNIKKEILKRLDEFFGQANEQAWKESTET